MESNQQPQNNLKPSNAQYSKAIPILLGILAVGVVVALASTAMNRPKNNGNRNVVVNNANVQTNQNANTPTNQQMNQNSKVNTPIDTSDWKTYRNEGLGFEVKYPKDWKIEERTNARLFSEAGPFGDRYSFVSPDKDSNGYPYFMTITHITAKSPFIDALRFFDFVHRGDWVDKDKVEFTNVGFHGLTVVYVQEYNDLSRYYIIMQGNDYFELAYHNPKNEIIEDTIERIIRTLHFTRKQDWSWLYTHN